MLFILPSKLFAARLKAETTASASFFGRGLWDMASKKLRKIFLSRHGFYLDRRDERGVIIFSVKVQGS